MDELNHQIAKEFLDKFGFKEKLESALAQEDKGIRHIIAANLAIFGVAISIVLNSTGNPITPTFVLVSVSAFSTAVSFFLCLWYLLRITGERTLYFQKRQERIYEKAESRVLKVFDLIGKIIKSNLKTQYHLTNGDKSKIDKDSFINIFTENGQFIFTMIIELSLNETLLNSHKSFASPLNEKYSRLKFILDYLSEHIRNWGLVIGFILILCAVLIRFLVD